MTSNQATEIHESMFPLKLNLVFSTHKNESHNHISNTLETSHQVHGEHYNPHDIKNNNNNSQETHDKEHFTFQSHINTENQHCPKTPKPSRFHGTCN